MYVACHLTSKPLHTKRDKHHLAQGGHGILCLPRMKKWGGNVPRVTHQIAPMQYITKPKEKNVGDMAFYISTV